MNRLYRTLWYFNRTRKTFGLVQALAVTLWGLRNPWYRDNHILGNEVDRIAGAYLDETIPGVTLMDALRYAAWKVQQLQAVRDVEWETSYRNDPNAQGPIIPYSGPVVNEEDQTKKPFDWDAAEATSEPIVFTSDSPAVELDNLVGAIDDEMYLLEEDK